VGVEGESIPAMDLLTLIPSGTAAEMLQTGRSILQLFSEFGANVGQDLSWQIAESDPHWLPGQVLAYK
jgi:hypothetical protein